LIFRLRIPSFSLIKLPTGVLSLKSRLNKERTEVKRSNIQLKITCLFSVILVTFVFASNSFAQKDKIVESIDIQGNRRLPDAEILKYIKTKVGEAYTDGQLQQDLEALNKLGLFDERNTRVFVEAARRGGTAVIFQVMELPLIVELKMEGLQKITDEEILTVLREKGVEIKAGMPLRPTKLRQAREVLTKYLAEKGFDDIRIEFTTEEVTAITVKVSFIFKYKSGVKFIKIKPTTYVSNLKSN
jgi:outer membrane protein insertion porin family